MTIWAKVTIKSERKTIFHLILMTSIQAAEKVSQLSQQIVTRNNDTNDCYIITPQIIWLSRNTLEMVEKVKSTLRQVTIQPDLFQVSVAWSDYKFCYSQGEMFFRCKGTLQHFVRLPRTLAGTYLQSLVEKGNYVRKCPAQDLKSHRKTWEKSLLLSLTVRVTNDHIGYDGKQRNETWGLYVFQKIQ